MMPVPPAPGGVPKQYRRRWYFDNHAGGKYRLVARGSHSHAEVQMMVGDLVALLQETGVPVAPVEAADHPRILISDTGEGKHLHIQGDFEPGELLLILAKLK